MGPYRMGIAKNLGFSERKARRKAKVLYYIDEFSILLATLLAVVFSDAIATRASGGSATSGDILLDWVNMTISGILALVTYATLHTQFKFNDKKKPPYIKRLTTALSQGIAWRVVIGWVN
jgi:hypothetical protein